MSNPKLVKQLEKDTDPAQFNIDNAFLKACQNCGIDPVELKGKALDSFQKKGTPDDIAIRRFNNHQNARVRKLYLVVTERKRLLADEELHGTVVKSPRRQEQSEKKKKTRNGDDGPNEEDKANAGKKHDDDEGETTTPRNKEASTSGNKNKKKEVRQPKPPGSKRDEGGSGRNKKNASSDSNQNEEGEATDPTPTDGNASETSSQATQRRRDQKDMMMERARRQRQQWDLVNERHERSRQAVEALRHDEIAKSKDYAESYRKQREVELEERKILNELNQEQMKKRWKRDEELAEKRQRRIDGDFEHRFDQFENHQAQILRARAKRDEQLALSAKEDSDSRIANRLERARMVRETEEERKRNAAEARVNAIEEQRRVHVYEQFVKLTKQNEKALRDREHTQAVIDRSEKNKMDRAQHTMARIDEVDERSTQRKDSLKATKTVELEEKGGKRDSSHKTARERRRQLAEQQQQARDELEKERLERQEERKKRQELQRNLVLEDAAAKEEYHQDVLKRVARVAEVQQESKLKVFEGRRQHHAERMKQLNEIRSILKE